MNWQKVALKIVAPSIPSKATLPPDEPVWLLTLDQIESNTGKIVHKKTGLPSGAGSSTNVFDETNVLYSKLRPYLNKVICPSEKGIATTELVPLKPLEGILERRFLTYYLRSSHFLNFANLAVAGVKMPRIIMADFWKHEIPLPPYSEQCHIAEILDQADALRKKRTEADEKASRILQALFYEMFGDPIVNLQTMPTDTLGNLLIALRNGTTADQNQDGRGYPVTRIETISDGVINLNRVRYVDLDSRELAKWRMEPGDILFSHINSEAHIGKTAIYEGDPSTLVHGMNLLLMRPNTAKVVPEYLFAMLNTVSVRAAFRQRCKRAVNQASLNQRDISGLEVAVAGIKAQKAFCKRTITTLEVLKQQHAATESIEKLFENLLHQAFIGKLTAKWRKSRMERLLAEMEEQANALAGSTK